MKIILEEDRLSLVWENPIQHRDNEKNGKNYPTHMATFPRELRELWGIESFFIMGCGEEKEDNEKRFVVTPLPQEESWQISLYKRGKNSRVFNLPKKCIDSLDEYTFVKFCFDGRMCMMSLF